MQSWFDNFLEKAPLSCWQTYDIPAQSGPCPQGHHNVNGRYVPRRVDGFGVGNGLVLAIVGVRFYQDKLFPTAISHLRGPTMAYRILQESQPSTRRSYYLSPQPGQDFLIEIDGEVAAPEEADWRNGRGFLGAAIASGVLRKDGVELCTIDFAPQDPPLPAIVRAVRVTNRGSRPVDVSIYCYLCLEKRTPFSGMFNCAAYEKDYGLFAYGVTESMTKFNFNREADQPVVVLLHIEGPRVCGGVGERGDTCWEGIRAGATLQRQSSRMPFDGYVKVSLGSLAPYSSKVFTCSILTGYSREEVLTTLDALQAESIQFLLERTYSFWQNWCNQPTMKTSSARVNHLIDNIKVMAKCFINNGKEFATGSTYYGGGTWGRDSYYQARGLLACGHYQEVKNHILAYKQFMARYGVLHCYHLDGTPGDFSIVGNYELPAIFVLLARDYFRYVGKFELHQDMVAFVEDAISQQRLTQNSLACLSGDETWRVAGSYTDIRSEQSENSYLAALAYEFAYELTGKPHYKQTAEQVRKAMAKYLVASKGWYAHFRTLDGTLDERPLANCMARPLLLDFPRTTAELAIVRKGIQAAWRYCRTEAGIVRTDPMSTGMCGNTPGYFIYALGEINSVAADSLFWSTVDFAASSGVYWEFPQTHAEGFSGEKWRLWDSSSVMEGLVHYLYGIKPLADGVEVAPHLPHGLDSLEVSDFQIRDTVLNFSLRGCSSSKVATYHSESPATPSQEQDRFKLQDLKPRVVLESDKPLRYRRCGTVIELVPMGKTPPYLDVNPMSYDINRRVLRLSALGNVKLKLAGIGYVEQVKGAVSRKTVTNTTSAELTVQCDDEVVTLSPGQRKSFETIGERLTNEFFLLTPVYQIIDEVEPGQAFILRGKLAYPNGQGWVGNPTVSFNNETVKLSTDDYGYYEVRLNAPERAGEYRLTVTAGSEVFHREVMVLQDPMNRIDTVLAEHGLPNCRILVEGQDEAVRMAWEIWYAVLEAKAIDLPVVFNPEEHAQLHTIKIGDVPLDYTLTAERRGYSIRSDKRGRFVMSLPLSDDVRDAQPFINDLWMNVCYPAGRGQGLREYARCFTGSVQVELDFPQIDNCYIGPNRATSGTLTAAEGCCPKKLPLPYVKVGLSHNELVVETDAPEPITGRITLTVPPPVSLIDNIPVDRHEDPARDVVQWKALPDGSKQIIAELTPGRKLKESRVLSKPTYRRLTVRLPYLLPEWYKLKTG